MSWQRLGMFRRDRQRMRRAQGNRCALCGEILGSALATFEHVLPRSRGGKNRGNLVLTHQRCNHSRGDAMPTGCLLIWLDLVNTKIAADSSRLDPVAIAFGPTGGQVADQQFGAVAEVIGHGGLSFCHGQRAGAHVLGDFLAQDRASIDLAAEEAGHQFERQRGIGGGLQRVGGEIGHGQSFRAPCGRAARAWQSAGGEARLHMGVGTDG